MVRTNSVKYPHKLNLNDKNMARADDMAEQLKGSIINKLGPRAEEDIFKVKTPKNPAIRAQWVKESIARLDESVDEATRGEIMHGNGVNCANHNVGVVKAAIKRRGKYRSLGDFIDAEVKTPQKGTSIERDGDALILSYLPRLYSHPMRCFCGLVKSLPEGETMSLTYCKCSVAFVETWWSAIIGKPVDVKLLESAITGSDKCRFRIKW